MIFVSIGFSTDIVNNLVLVIIIGSVVPMENLPESDFPPLVLQGQSALVLNLVPIDLGPVDPHPIVVKRGMFADGSAVKSREKVAEILGRFALLEHDHVVVDAGLGELRAEVDGEHVRGQILRDLNLFNPQFFYTVDSA